MKRTVGSPEAWEFLAGIACFPSEMSENASVFPTDLPFIQKVGRRALFNGNSHFSDSKQKT